MRCKICDYDPELSFGEQSIYFRGLSMEYTPSVKLVEGELECNCFSFGKIGHLSEEDVSLLV